MKANSHKKARICSDVNPSYPTSSTAGVRPRAAYAAKSRVTCLNSTNSISSSEISFESPPEVSCLKVVTNSRGSQVVREKDITGRWKRAELSQRDKQQAFALKENIQAWIKEYGIERFVFGTITTRDRPTLKEFNKRINSLRTNVLNKVMHVIPFMIRENHLTGQWHCHYLGILDFDCLTGFDFKSYDNAEKELRKNGKTSRWRQLKANYARSADPKLRSIWTQTRKASAGHGFGYHNILPIRSNAEAISKYLTKYLTKSLQARDNAPKGSRIISYSTKVTRAVKGHVGWVSEGAKESRRKQALFAKFAGCTEDTISDRIGTTQWFGKYMNTIDRIDEINLRNPEHLRFVKNLRAGLLPKCLFKHHNETHWIFHKDNSIKVVHGELRPQDVERLSESTEEWHARIQARFGEPDPPPKPPSKSFSDLNNDIDWSLYLA